MFAVVKIAGQQYKVKAGQSLFVPHLAGKTGDKVEFNDVLFLENDGIISLQAEAKATVTADIINDLIKGEKVIAFKMKRRKGFRKKHGHRTQYTQIKVTGIAGNDTADDTVDNDTLPATVDNNTTNDTVVNGSENE